MRRLVVTEFVSLDGVMEAPDQWHFPFWSDEMGAYKCREVMQSDALLLGRTTYESMAGAWPGYEDEIGFADRMNSMPKYVVSTSIDTAEWANSHVIGANVVDEVRRLKQEDGQDILLAGSKSLIDSLVDEDVIDAWRLMIHPVVVGRGTRVFGDREIPQSLSLTSVEPLPNGVLVLTYEPAAAPAS
jgi:dihydrofolate reductase